MSVEIIILLIITGIICGFINTLAGSGSFISLPILIFLGLDAGIANATNRLAVLLQCAAGVVGFKKYGYFDFKGVMWLIVPSAIGSAIGALIAVNFEVRHMEFAIAITMLIMLVIMLIDPTKRIKQNILIPDKKLRKVLEFIVLLAIGVYGGFIQAGAGIFLLISLSLISGYDLIRANGAKIFINLVFTIFSVAIFAWEGKIDYTYGLVLALGNVSGTIIATKLAVKHGVKLVRWLVIIIMFLTAVKLLFF